MPSYFRSSFVALFFATSLTACGGGSDSDSNSGGGDGGGGETNVKPTAAITFPKQSSVFPAETITVRGTAADSDGSVVAVTVNGVSATSTDGFATWSAEVALSEGANNISVSVEDDDGETTAGASAVEIKRARLPFSIPTSLVADAGSTRLIGLDSGHGNVFALDIASGERSIVTGSGIGSGPVLSGSFGLDYAETSETVYVADWGTSSVLAVNTTTGERTVISSAEVGSGSAFDRVYDVAVDEAGGRVFVSDPLHYNTSPFWAIISIDIATGNRTVISDGGTGTGPSLAGGRYLEWDEANSRLLVAVTNTTVFAVDPATGDRTQVIDYFGGLDTYLYDIALREGSDELFMVTIDPATYVGKIYSGNLVDRSVQLISDDTATEGADITGINGLAFHPESNLLYAGNDQGDFIMEINATGERTIISDSLDSEHGTGSEFGEPWYAQFDLDNNVAYSIDRRADTLIKVDLSTGSRTTLSDDGVDWEPQALRVDSANERLLVLSTEGTGALYEVNTTTGSRTKLGDLDAATELSTADFVFDGAGNRIFYDADGFGQAIREVSLDTFTERLVADASNGPDTLGSVTSMQLDLDRNRLLVVSSEALAEVDITAGDVNTLIGPSSTTNEGWLYGWKSAFDPTANRIHVLDDRTNQLMRVNLETLEIDTLLDGGNSSSAMVGLVRGIAVDNGEDVLWVVDFGTGSVQSIDLQSGDGVIIAR